MSIYQSPSRQSFAMSTHVQGHALIAGKQVPPMAVGALTSYHCSMRGIASCRSRCSGEDKMAPY